MVHSESGSWRLGSGVVGIRMELPEEFVVGLEQ